MSRRNSIAVFLALCALAIAFADSNAQVVRLPSRFVPGDAPIAPAAKDQTAPFLARAGTTTLAVWTDSRANTEGTLTEGETSKDIYGMRLDAAGNPLDAAPFAIAVGRASQEVPRAAWNGTHWLVVYESYDLNGTGYYYQKSLEAVRVAPDGHVADAKPIKLYSVTPTGGIWAVASDGSGWVIAIQGTSSSGDIVALRVSAAGLPLDPGGRSLVPQTYYGRGNHRLAFANGVYLLTYDEALTGSSETSALRFDASLNPLDSPHTLVPVPISALDSNGSQFYAVWNEQQPDFTMAVKGSRIGTNGQLLDGGGAGVILSGANRPDSDTTTSVAWDGSNWKASWGSGGVLRIARINTSGQVLDPGGISVAGPPSGVTASAGNGSLQIAWTVLTSGAYDVMTANVSASNVAGPNRPASVSAPLQTSPDVATSGTGYLLVYQSNTSARHRVLAQPLDAAGNPLTAEPVELDAADSATLPGPPAVAWNGSLYMAAWENASGVVVRRLTPTGTLIDPAPILVLNPGFGATDIEAIGADFLVTGRRCSFNCEVIFPIATRVRGSDAAVLDPGAIQISGQFCSSVRTVALGGKWLVAFQNNVTHDNPAASTDGVFIQTNGVKGTEFRIHGGYSTSGGNGIHSVGLASSGTMALMVQSQELSSGTETDVLARFIDAQGTVQPVINLTPWMGNQYRPRAAWDGSQFIVVLQDQKTRFADWTLDQLDARSDLVGMRVDPAGAIRDPQGFIFSNSPGGEAFPTVAAAGGKTLIAGAIVRNLPALASYRVGYDLFGAGGNAWPVAVATATPADGDVPLSVAFSSAGSGDPDGVISGTSWSFGDGASSTDPNPTHLYTAGGPYVATLTVTDAGGAQTVQQLKMLVSEPNILPIAVASSDRTSGPAPLDVVFQAAGSYDPDGFIGNIGWTFGDGGDYWGATAYHTFDQPGSWPVTLTVYDGRGGTGTTTLTIDVGPPLPPDPPTNLTATSYTPDSISLSWSDNAYNEDGYRLERCPGTAAFCAVNPSSWTFLVEAGRNANSWWDTPLGSNATYSYRVRAHNLTASSAWSNVATATTQDIAPTARFVTSVLNGPAPLPVAFDGSGSSDPDGGIVSWAWTFGDGATGSGAIVSHTYSSVGNRTVTLTVTDNAGATSSATTVIGVKPGNARSVAGADGSTPLGSISSGTYADTQTQNDTAEVLLEARTSGSPATRKSLLEHTWTLDVAAGGTQTFYLDAWHSPNTEGDDFLFEYSRDTLSWTPMVTVTRTSDTDSIQSYLFTQDVTGRIYVRVRDLDRTPGRSQADTVSVDEMFVSSSSSSGASGEVPGNQAVVDTQMLTVVPWGGSVKLDWGASCAPTDTDYAVYEGTIGVFTSHVPVLCSTSGATTATVSSDSENRYYLVVPTDTYYEGRYGMSSAGVPIPAGVTRCYAAALVIGCP